MDEAIDYGANVIISYHPPLFREFKRISQNNWKDRLVTKALKHEIAIYRMVTIYVLSTEQTFYFRYFSS